MRHYLAIDIGASSGRHLWGCLEEGRLILEETHRFPNGMSERNGSLCWDTDAIVSDVTAGIRKSKRCDSIGIDTWAVDFALLDADGNLLGDTVAYRDSRTDGMDAEVERLIPFEEHYARTGIQKQPFNTVYQLMALKRTSPGLLEAADSMLLIPDYIHYRLNREKRSEYTNASTTGLLNAGTRDWDWEMIDRLGFPRRIFQPVGYDLTPSHDTAAAFLMADSDSVLISSGTWSLLGIAGDRPILTETARKAGFTNEGGFGGKIRFLKNIMGLWMIQSIQKELPGSLSFTEMRDMARMSGYDGLVDVNDAAFFAPDSMMNAVIQKCTEAGYARPNGAGDLLRCVYLSLAREYARSVRELERITGRTYRSIRIIGGGSKNDFLNELTAQATGLPVYAGPAEGTAIGNIVSQMIKSGELPNLGAAHEAIRAGFPPAEFLP
jgi:rhamnulokinase